MAGIFYANYYLPNNFIRVEDLFRGLQNFTLSGYYKSLEEFCKDFRSHSGLDKVTIEDNANCVEIFSGLLEQFFSEKKIDPGKVAYVFYTNTKCSSLNGVNIPQLLQKKFNMANASVVTIEQGCAGTLWCMGASNSLLRGREEKYSIILSANFMHSIEERYLFPTLLGDASGIMVLGNANSNLKVIEGISVTDGTFSYEKYNHISREMNKLTLIKQSAEVVHMLLDRNKLSIEDIYIMIPQSINFLSYTTIFPNMLNLSPDRVFVQNIPNGGHLGDVDTIRNLKDYIDIQRVPQNAYLLLFGLGYVDGDLNHNAVLVQNKLK